MVIRRSHIALSLAVASVSLACGGGPSESSGVAASAAADAVLSGEVIHETVVRRGPDGSPIVTEVDVPIEQVWAIGKARSEAREAYLSGKSAGQPVSVLPILPQANTAGVGTSTSAIQIDSTCNGNDLWLLDTDNGANCSSPSGNTRLLCFNAFDGYSGSYYLNAAGTQYNVGSYWNAHVAEYSPGSEVGNIEFENSDYPDGCWQEWSIPADEYGCYHAADTYNSNPDCSPYTLTDLVALSE